MNRRARIGIVIGVALTLVGIFIAYVGSPLIASFFMPSAVSPNGIDDIGAMMDSMDTASRVAETSRKISIIALLLSLGAFVYTISVLAMWFVKSAPPETPES